MQKLLTIVVPVYKVEPYINKCLDSCVLDDEELMNQLEVIIVNDGTPDNSAEMSREYAKRYPNTFRQIDKENGGHGSAWNVGLKEATGKYLRFLDSDDWLTNLDKLMEKLQKTNVDLVFTQMDMYMVMENKFVRYPVNGECDKELPITSFPYKLTDSQTVANFQYCTYKTSMLKPYYPLFDEHVYYDDIILHSATVLLAKDYVILNFPLYQYLIGREGQTMSADVLMKNAEMLDKELRKALKFYISTRKETTLEQQLWACRAICGVLLNTLIMPMPLMNFKDFRRTAILYRDVISVMTIEESQPKRTKRLVKYPDWMSFCIEKIRLLKNK